MLLLVFAILATTVVVSSEPLYVSKTLLTVIDGEFVSLHVGYPGRKLLFQLRWDLNDIFILYPNSITAYSHTFEEQPQSIYMVSDLICFSECIRMPLLLGISPPPPEQIPYLFSMDTSEATNYQGVIGLAANSSLWSIFRWIRVESDQLILSPYSTLASSSFVHDSESEPGVFAVRLDTGSYWAVMQLQNEWTLLPSEFAYSDSEWKLQLVDSKRSSTLRISREDTFVKSAHGRAVRPFRALDQLSEDQTPHVNITSTSGGGGWTWSANMTVFLGRLLIRDNFVIELDTWTGHMAAQVHSETHPHVDRLDYLALYLIVVPLWMLWLLSVYSSIDRYRRANYSLVPRAPHGETYLVLQNSKIRLPIDNAAAFSKRERSQTLRHIPLMSFRHRNFVGALMFYTRLVCAVVWLFIVLALGFDHSYQHMGWKQQDRIALYSALVACYLFSALPSTPLMNSFPVVFTVWMSSALLLLVWALSAILPAAAASGFLMLASAALIAIRSLELLYLTLSNALFRDEAHRTRKWLWLIMFSVQTVWAVWFFCFYTVPVVTLEWRKDDPAVYALSVASLLFVVAFGAIYNVLQERLVAVTYRAHVLNDMFQQIANLSYQIMTMGNDILHFTPIVYNSARPVRMRTTTTTTTKSMKR